MIRQSAPLQVANSCVGVSRVTIRLQFAWIAEWQRRSHARSLIGGGNDGLRIDANSIRGGLTGLNLDQGPFINKFPLPTLTRPCPTTTSGTPPPAS
jgi:hypothetical protein